jgi:adenylate cyclase
MHVPVPLHGVLSMPFRLFGIRPSRMNPNTCTICELMFTKVMKARKITIDATILFADLRGYTSLSQSQSSEAVSGLLDAFYDECARAIWERDGLLNKTIGDAVMAIFNFPINQSDHPRQAVLAAQDIQRRWSARRWCRSWVSPATNWGSASGSIAGNSVSGNSAARIAT